MLHLAGPAVVVDIPHNTNITGESDVVSILLP